MTALGNPDTIKGPVMSNIFEVKRDNVRVTIPQAVIAAASHCRQHKYDLFSSNLVILHTFRSVSRC